MAAEPRGDATGSPGASEGAATPAGSAHADAAPQDAEPETVFIADEYEVATAGGRRAEVIIPSLPKIIVTDHDGGSSWQRTGKGWVASSYGARTPTLDTLRRWDPSSEPLQAAVDAEKAALTVAQAAARARQLQRCGSDMCPAAAKDFLCVPGVGDPTGGKERMPPEAFERGYPSPPSAGAAGRTTSPGTPHRDVDCGRTCSAAALRRCLSELRGPSVESVLMELRMDEFAAAFRHRGAKDLGSLCRLEPSQVRDVIRDQALEGRLLRHLAREKERAAQQGQRRSTSPAQLARHGSHGSPRHAPHAPGGEGGRTASPKSSAAVPAAGSQASPPRTRSPPNLLAVRRCHTSPVHPHRFIGPQLQELTRPSNEAALHSVVRSHSLGSDTSRGAHGAAGHGASPPRPAPLRIDSAGGEGADLVPPGPPTPSPAPPPAETVTVSGSECTAPRRAGAIAAAPPPLGTPAKGPAQPPPPPPLPGSRAPGGGTGLLRRSPTPPRICSAPVHPAARQQPRRVPPQQQQQQQQQRARDRARPPVSGGARGDAGRRFRRSYTEPRRSTAAETAVHSAAAAAAAAPAPSRASRRSASSGPVRPPDSVLQTPPSAKSARPGRGGAAPRSQPTRERAKPITTPAASATARRPQRPQPQQAGNRDSGPSSTSHGLSTAPSASSRAPSPPHKGRTATPGRQGRSAATGGARSTATSASRSLPGGRAQSVPRPRRTASAASRPGGGGVRSLSPAPAHRLRQSTTTIGSAALRSSATTVASPQQGRTRRRTAHSQPPPRPSPKPSSRPNTPQKPRGPRPKPPRQMGSPIHW